MIFPQCVTCVLSDGSTCASSEALQAPPGCLTLSAEGKLVMPGGIDPHVHLTMPFMGTEAVDDYFTCAQPFASVVYIV